LSRPNFKNIKTSTELKKWYWLKEELVGFAKAIRINYSGSKFEILDRLANAIDGKKIPASKKIKPSSTFNWANATLTPKTIITDSYTNGPNTRKFFIAHCGKKFSFNIPFMAWMKANSGKTLAHAIVEWKRIERLKRDTNFKSSIPAGNQYNKYLRDFFADNPTLKIEQARQCWKLKRALPLGKHVYEKSDLKLK
jgi:hypothetical protein